MKYFIFAVSALGGAVFSEWKPLVAWGRMQFTAVTTAEAVYLN